MAYASIDNLYKNQDILLFKECYALEKIHGSSAHVGWAADSVADLIFFPGGESYDRFVALFDQQDLRKRISDLGHQHVVVYGEVYGGRCQGMSRVYGPDLRFIVFDVKIGESWLSVPDMDQVATGLGLEVVPYQRIPADIAAIDADRDRPSEVAIRRGTGKHPREGVVLRPLIELTKNNGDRIIAKHKIEKFTERTTPQKILDPARLKILEEAQAIAAEWVTPMRLAHVLQKFSPGAEMDQTRDLIRSMIEDVYREAKGEIVESKEAQAAIGKRTAQLFRDWLASAL